MTTEVNVLERLPGRIVLMEAIAEKMFSGPYDETSPLSKRGTTVTVQVLVNGVEVDYMQVLESTIDKWHEQYRVEFDTVVNEEIGKRINGSAVRDAMEHFDAAAWQIREAARKLGVDLL